MDIIDLVFDLKNVFTVRRLAIKHVFQDFLPNFIKIFLFIVFRPRFEDFRDLKVLKETDITQNIELCAFPHPIAQTNELRGLNFEEIRFFVDQTPTKNMHDPAWTHCIVLLHFSELVMVVDDPEFIRVARKLIIFDTMDEFNRRGVPVFGEKRDGVFSC